MATKLEYLKKSITTANVISNKSWYVSTIGIPLTSTQDKWNNNSTPLTIVVKPKGMFYTDLAEDGSVTLIPISDYKKDTPLFTFQDLIEVDSSWLPSIKSKITTKLGNLILNALVIYPSLKTKLDYINTPISVKLLEGILASRVKNEDEAKPGDILVPEMIECIDRLYFVTNLADIVNIASTPKVITPPPGIDKLKKDLLKEYEGQLDDPVKLVEMSKKLTDADDAYLADDPSATKIFSKKQKNARKKLYLIFGEALAFEPSTKTNAVMPSLSEGISSDPDDFVKYMNDLRMGSYARGASTQLAGYAYKILQRSLSNLTINRTPCNTKVGIKRVIFKSTASKLINRYVKEQGKWILIESIDQANKYIDKVVEMRSAAYCTTEGNSICYQCLSEVYKESPSGVTNMAAELSSVLLNAFLKLTHGKEIEAMQIDVADLTT